MIFVSYVMFAAGTVLLVGSTCILATTKRNTEQGKASVGPALLILGYYAAAAVARYLAT